MPKITTARRDMIAAATRLFQQRGLHGSGMQDIVAAADAPRGSIYHHFPGGKDELAIAAITATTQIVSEAIDRFGREAKSPAEVVSHVAALFRAAPEAAGWTLGCPVVATAVEGDLQSAPVRDAVARAFGTWANAATAALVTSGLPAARAAPLGFTLVAAIEGALVVSRGLRSADAYDATVDALTALCRV